MKINFKKTKFIISCPTLETQPKDQYPEIVFVGKSNVGKSTLINALTGQKIAHASKKAGKTKLLNYFLVDEKFYLVDAPGYGYTSYGNKKDDEFAKMMEPFFENNRFLKGALILADVRRGLSNDEVNMVNYLDELNIPVIVVFTKCDSSKQKERYAAVKKAKDIGIKEEEIFMSKQGQDYHDLRGMIARLIS